MNIPFNKPIITGRELYYIDKVLENGKLSGDGPFTHKCNHWFERKFSCKKALLTTSCTHALEMAAILADIQLGDEVIMPSYTFVSTANAFVLRGARIVFVDIRPDTMNIDETLIELAITDKTKAIVPVHYAGVACEMDVIMDIALRYNLLVIEDAAQGVMSKYKNKYLGTIGDLGCFSFHETKNYSSGEGGALIINDERFISRAEIIREKGTNRSNFVRGQVDKYTWVDIGSSYLPSELNAAYLYAQLEMADEINNGRLYSWQMYYDGLRYLQEAGLIELPVIPECSQHNGHIFFVKTNNLNERIKLISYLKEKGVGTATHYVPLHGSVMGFERSHFSGEDIFTTCESNRILRLPIYYGINDYEINNVIELLRNYYA